MKSRQQGEGAIWGPLSFLALNYKIRLLVYKATSVPALKGVYFIQGRQGAGTASSSMPDRRQVAGWSMQRMTAVATDRAMQPKAEALATRSGEIPQNSQGQESLGRPQRTWTQGHTFPLGLI